MRIIRCALIIIFFSLTDFIYAENTVASRMEGDTIHYYATLHEAVDAASGLSIDNPDVITLLADITVNAPLIIEDRKHIALIPGNGSRTISRAYDFLDYPVIWLRGDSASLSLGLTTNSSQVSNGYELIIDGGYKQHPPIEAHAVLVAVSGPGSKLIMHNNVFLQNNMNNSRTSVNTYYQYGAGVLIRTLDDLSSRPAEFIMRGGSILGNINNVQNAPAYGGGVYINGFGIFTMEGGNIHNNTAQRAGGGVFIYSTGTYKKTGGIIQGNIAIDGVGDSRFFGHSVFIGSADTNFFRYRNDTVGENDMLSYTGSLSGSGVFGEGERWSQPRAVLSNYVFFIIFAVLALGLFFFFFIRQNAKPRHLTAEQRLKIPDPGVKLSPREREVFDLFLSGQTAKQAAQTLGISISSINFHSENMYRKLGIQSRTELLVKFKG